MRNPWTPSPARLALGPLGSEKNPVLLPRGAQPVIKPVVARDDGEYEVYDALPPAIKAAYQDSDVPLRCSDVRKLHILGLTEAEIIEEIRKADHYWQPVLDQFGWVKKGTI